MEFLKALSFEFKEILYDFFGYLLPGYFLLLILSMPLLINEYCSPMYALFEIFFNTKITINLLKLIDNYSFLSLLIISFVSYLLGHIPNFISELFNPFMNLIFKKLNLAQNENEENISFLRNNILSILKNSCKFQKDLFEYPSDENNKKYNNYILKTFASTYSRFTSHNDLIQKYTCKVNFFSSFSSLFLIMFFDSVISTFIWLNFNSPNYNNYIFIKLISINCFIFLFSATFFKQYKKHLNLKTKECYLFLYEYFS